MTDFLPPPLPPIPVQPLGFQPMASARRPGLIVTIGIMSILVGIGSLLLTGILVLQGLIIFNASSRLTAVKTAQGQLQQQAANAVAHAGPEDGMTVVERGVVHAGLSEVTVLSAARRDQLDALLAETGNTIFLLRGTSLTPAAVKANVSDTTRFPAVGGREGPDVLIVGQGRIEIYDDHAGFFPSDGSQPVRVDGGRVTDAAGNRVLGAAHVQAIVDRVRELGGRAPLPAQVRGLTQALNAPGQQLVTPSASPQALAAQVRYASVMPDGSVLVAFGNSGITLATNGQATTWSAAGPPPMAGGPATPIPGASVALAVGLSFMSGALAIYLIVAGSLVLRQSPSGRLHHRIYAWMKIAVSMAAGVAWVWFWTAMATSQGAADTTPAKVAGVLVGILGCVYPIAVLLAFRARSVREYYASGWQ